MPLDDTEFSSLPTFQQQYRLINDIYVFLDHGDRRVLSAFDLTTSQYGALLFLDSEQGQRLTYLSDRLILDKSTITRIVNQLEQNGLVRRVTDPEDRRAQRVVLTPRGVERRHYACDAHEASLKSRLGALSQDEQAQLYALLHKLRDSLQHRLASENG